MIPTHIYFKNEGVSPTGSHKSNTAIAQAYYNIKQGVHHLITETDAGQWGSALSLAGSVFDIDSAAPLVSQLLDAKLIEAVAYGQDEIFPAAVLFARTEGIIPAPESAHAIKAVMVEAEKAKQEGKERVILFNLSGHGHLRRLSVREYE